MHAIEARLAPCDTSLFRIFTKRRSNHEGYEPLRANVLWLGYLKMCQAQQFCQCSQPSVPSTLDVAWQQWLLQFVETVDDEIGMNLMFDLDTFCAFCMRFRCGMFQLSCCVLTSNSRMKRLKGTVVKEKSHAMMSVPMHWTTAVKAYLSEQFCNCGNGRLCIAEVDGLFLLNPGGVPQKESQIWSLTAARICRTCDAFLSGESRMRR